MPRKANTWTMRDYLASINNILRPYSFEYRLRIKETKKGNLYTLVLYFEGRIHRFIWEDKGENFLRQALQGLRENILGMRISEDDSAIPTRERMYL